MAGIKKSGSAGEYSINYSLMGGVDFSSPDSISGRRRFAYLENMYRDYDGEGAELTESIPGFRKLAAFGSKINGFYLQRIKKGEEYVIVHAGASVYRTSLKDVDIMYTITANDSLKTVNNQKSTGFSFGKSVYILDGSKILRIDENGSAEFVSDGTSAAPYIPTTYVNGEEHEQLNLLTRQFFEEFYVAYPEDASYASPKLEYRITDKDMKKCAVTGFSESDVNELYIPSYTTIGGERYEVEKIDELAFAKNTVLRAVSIGDGVREIGTKAFSEASNIIKITLPDSVEVIQAGAFASCTALAEIRFGKDLVSIAAGAFSGCAGLTTIKYAYDRAAFSQIDGASAIPTPHTFVENSKNDTMRATIPIKTPTNSLIEILIGDASVSFIPVFDGELIKSVIIPSIEKAKLESAFIKIRGYAHETKFNFNSPGINFISGMAGQSPAEAINCCTVCECFDERIFLSGNPSFPNTVFYSARDKNGNINPLYFGVMNYFNDGVGGFPVISLLAAGDSLAVFKSGDDGGGSIFYHVPKETGIDILPKVYPVSYIHNGIAAVGKSISFFDDPVFISGVGLSALDKKAINLERSIACRSHNVNPLLLSENLQNADLAVWCGYLAVLCEGKIFLADSRALFRHETGNTEYEWYYLNGIGTHKNAAFIYEYIKSSVDRCQTKHEMLGKEVTKGSVYSAVTNDGVSYFYVTEKGIQYQVGRSDERRGGTFNPATILFSIDNRLLFFGTDNGDVCLFNNDKRGVPPPRVLSSPDFDKAAYDALMKRSIHPDFYSFDYHAPRYALSTVSDDGGVPDLTKDTVRGSLTLKCKSFGTGEIILEVGTDKRGYSEVAEFKDVKLNFEDLDFANIAFFGESRLSVPFGEKERGWVEKQISLFSEKFRAPIGIYSISYRFRPRGRIKKTKI